MNSYLITFFTHYGAISTKKRLQDISITSQIAPIPRKISSSCGTCLIYESDSPHRELIDMDFEAVYLLENDEYTLLFES
ncbi:MAG: DUF3343 domain-containing protein [Clostridia bacterium]|nr:DUF3343 domain-containing protein [Clostridia bacterium]